MAKNLNLAVETFEAGSDLSAAQFQAVAYAADGQVDLAGAAAVQVVGILQDNAGSAAGLAVQVGPALAGGVTKWKAGAAVANGAFVTTDSTGRCVLAGTTGNAIWGIAQSAAGAANEIISVKFGYLGLAL
ncbi:MAG: hypothetical protein DRQ39_09100 [Gammaproteobacteria bacterium]|nr:MAG: hypothetical protein DRQ39_09100 [Gammaproteobacteria bacterium]